MVKKRVLDCFLNFPSDKTAPAIAWHIPVPHGLLESSGSSPAHVSNPLIKICGIKDPNLASAAAKAGANYIGLVFHPESPRHVELEEAIMLSQAIHSAGAVPVAVFVNQTEVEMRAICEAANIQSVQLHGNIARKAHPLLPKNYQRFYVQTEWQDHDENLHYLDKDRDFILIDHTKPDGLLESLRSAPGQSPTINCKKFNNMTHFRWFLAGGLTSVNVQTAIAMLQPDGVDVSSGVELSVGNKDLALIKQFILAVGGHYAR